jgi:hypothetical protein
MPLYTVLLDFKGGTYVSQCRATSPSAAIRKWARELQTDAISGIGKLGKSQLIDDVQSDDPVALEGLSNTWCHSALVRGHLALINIVQTDLARKPSAADISKNQL